MNKPAVQRGNPNAPIWVVAGWPTENDLYSRNAFSGSLGQELEGQLRQAGIDIDQVFFTYVTYRRPKDRDAADWFGTVSQVASRGLLKWGEANIIPELYHDIQDIRYQLSKSNATIVVALGELALLALTEQQGITNWRGSHLRTVSNIKCIPTYDPIKTMQVYEWRFIAVQDLRRVKRESYSLDYKAERPENYQIHLSYEENQAALAALFSRAETEAAEGRQLLLGVDCETRWGHITHLGIASSPADCLCIQFTSATTSSRYTIEEELEIVLRIRELLVHPAVVCVGQNFLYDIQYMAHDWGFIPTKYHDTMTAWHVCYSGLPKSLSFIASMVHPHYVYWKDSDPDNEVEYSKYNCRDCCRTYELWPQLSATLEAMHQMPQYEEQLAAQAPNLQMMLRGFKQNVNLRGTLSLQLMDVLAEREAWLCDFTKVLTGDAVLAKTKSAKPWYRSPTQQAKIFYELFGLPVQRNKKTKKPSCDDGALTELAKVEPLLQPIFDTILEYRSMGVLLSTFIQSPLDWDKRIRCSFGVGSTETFRNTSSEDVFGFGGNLQNIPKGDK